MCVVFFHLNVVCVCLNKDRTIDEQGAVVKSLFEEGEKPVNIFQRLKSQFGDVCMTNRTFYNLVDRYRDGRTWIFIYLFICVSHMYILYNKI